MRRQIQWAAAIFSLLPGLAAPNSGIIQVTGVRAWSHPGSTRVVIETSGLAEYRADHAQNPERLFFDVLKARPWINQHRVATRQVNDRLVRRVRIAETSPGTTRIVFDLVTSVEFKVTRLDTPDRIVIELTPSQGSLPAPPPQIITSRVSPTLSAERNADKLNTSTLHTRYKVFVPPVLPAPERSTVPIPVPPVTSYLAELTPVRFSDSGISLADIKIGRPRSNVAAAPATPTTRVLPGTRTTATNQTPKASADATLSLTRALGLKINRIVIDAGHGGHDEGTVGPSGVLEKDVVLDVALRLATLVQSRLGAEVVLTRSDDTFVPLTERTAIANDHKADLFLSIHANSSSTPAVAGTETFLLNFTSSPGAIAVAARENAGSDKSVGELRDLVQSITLNDKIAESQNFAGTIQSSLFSQAAKSNAAARDRGVKRAPFVVLIGAQMPSVLAEIGFLSNPKDESNLNKPEYRQKIAESLYRGLATYSQSLSHFEVAGTKPLVYSAPATR